MSDTPTPEDPAVPFMRRERPRAGRPDTVFYWPRHEGRQCVGKAMDSAFGPHVGHLLENERQVLRLLYSRGLPVARLVDYPAQPEWLVTEFGGLSLYLLSGTSSAGWPALPLHEYVSVWAHFLKRAGGFVDIGAIPIDLCARNLVVPLGQNGQLKLTEALSIDHAHTLLPGSQLPSGALRRPVWIGASNNQQLAPEVRGTLARDQEKFIARIKAQGAPLPGTTEMVTSEDRNTTNQIWLDYSEPQLIQQMVDEGKVDADRFIQYAVGFDIHRQLTETDPLTPALANVVSRLCASLPEERYPTVEVAAQALRSALGGKVAMASVRVYTPHLPADLVPSKTAKSFSMLDLAPFLTAPLQTDNQSAAQEGSTAQVRPSGSTHSTTGKGEKASSVQNISKDPTNIVETIRNSGSQGWAWILIAAAAAITVGIPLGNWLAGS